MMGKRNKVAYARIITSVYNPLSMLLDKNAHGERVAVRNYSKGIKS